MIAGILAVTFIIWREEKRGEAQAEQCRANYAAQALLERAAGNVSVYQQASEQQAIAAACEPNGYLFRLFGTANLPTIFLVFIGAIGIGAGLRTLWAIEKQTRATERSVALQAVQWVVLKNWQVSCERPDILNVHVEVHNETSFPLTIKRTDFRVGALINTTTEDIAIVPKSHLRVGFPHNLVDGEHIAYVNTSVVFGIRGAITYAGMSGITVQPFGGLMRASYRGSSFQLESAYETSAK